MFALLKLLFEKIEQLHSWHIAGIRREHALEKELAEKEAAIKSLQERNEALAKQVSELEQELEEAYHD